jgi:hypothetical protein
MYTYFTTQNIFQKTNFLFLNYYIINTEVRIEMNKIFDTFEKKTEKYLPSSGEGDNKATQAVTAATKLIYKWFNDGDVFDNNYGLEGWANDLSSYANWLDEYIEGTGDILDGIKKCQTEDGYEKLLEELADFILGLDLEELATHEAVGSIYRCDGSYSFSEKLTCNGCGCEISEREYSQYGGYCEFCSEYEDEYEDDDEEDWY